MILNLFNDFLEIGIDPECGASLTYFRTRGVKLFDVLREATQTAINKKDVLSMSMFVMLPYTSRIKGGFFTYWGITRQVSQNHPLFEDPIHGDGWRSAWTIEEQSQTKAVLSLVHKKNEGFPFNYSAQLTYELCDKSLHLSISISNDGIMPMPCGFGIHPFFTKTPNVSLQFPSKNVWTHQNDPIVVPYSTPKEWDFSTLKELKNADFDTCFGGFGEMASVVWPRYGMRLDMKTDENYGHIVLYSPPKKNFFCLEPSSMAPNAFNLASSGVVGTGIKGIGGRETITSHISFDVSGI